MPWRTTELCGIMRDATKVVVKSCKYVGEEHTHAQQMKISAAETRCNRRMTDKGQNTMEHTTSGDYCGLLLTPPHDIHTQGAE